MNISFTSSQAPSLAPPPPTPKPSLASLARPLPFVTSLHASPGESPSPALPPRSLSPPYSFLGRPPSNTLPIPPGAAQRPSPPPGLSDCPAGTPALSTTGPTGSSIYPPSPDGEPAPCRPFPSCRGYRDGSGGCGRVQGTQTRLSANALSAQGQRGHREGAVDSPGTTQESFVGEGPELGPGCLQLPCRAWHVWCQVHDRKV